MNLPLDLDFSIFFQPAVYKIVNKVTKKTYYGESGNIAARFARHEYLLQSGIHETSSLQDDWKTYGKENFSFEIVEMTPYLLDPKIRKDKETEYINQAKQCQQEVYNSSPFRFISGQINSIENTNPVRVDNLTYSTVTDAAQQYGLSINQAVALLEDESSNWFYLDPEKVLKKRSKYEGASKKVKVGDVVYTSISEAGRVHNIHPRTVKKRIYSCNFQDWSWATSPIEKKEKTVNKNARLVRIKGEYFMSMEEAAAFYGVNRATIKNRCHSSKEKFKNWTFINNLVNLVKKSYPVEIEGQFFASIQRAANYLKINKGTVKNRCFSSKEEFKNWFFVDRNGRRLNDYPERE